VAEDGSGAGLSKEALSGAEVGDLLRPHELERDFAAEHAVAGAVHHPHAARAEASGHVEMSDRPRLHASLPLVPTTR
jgi:hypothetical protein